MIENIISTRVKACPKCGGSLANGGDIYGRYITCIMCGAHIDLESAQSRPAAWPSRNPS